MILAVLLVIADRVGRSIADDKVAEQVAAQAKDQGVQLGAEPTVDITGFPFLTQVAAGTYDRVLVHLRDVQANAYSLPKLDVTASQVHADTGDLLDGHGPITADRVDGTATLGYDYLRQTAKDQLSKRAEVKDLTLSGTGGKLVVHVTVTEAGRDLKLIGSTKLSLGGDGTTVHIQVTDLKPDGFTLPPALQSILGQLADELSTDVQLPRLPYHLRLVDLTPGDEGLLVTARASNVTLAG